MTDERHLYLCNVPSGWRVERPSGTAILRQLTEEQAREWLRVAGYQDKGNGRFDRNDI